MSTINVSTEEELAKALEDGKDEIVIEIELGGKVIRIKAVGKIAWGLIAVALVAAIASFITSPATLGVGAVAGLGVAAPAIAVLGVSATTAAVLIGVHGGGIGTLNKLRKYTLKKLPDGRVLLTK